MPDPTPESDHLKGRGVAQYIRPLALVLFRRDDGAILVAPGFDPVKQQRFYRPLGGGIEFGERAEDALRREIQEEIGAELRAPRLLGVLENTFERGPLSATKFSSSSTRSLSARGVTFREEPRKEPYGMVVVFEDLYGNRWDLVER